MNTTNDTEALYSEFLSQHAKLKPKDHHLMSYNIDNMLCGADALIDESLLSPMTDENSRISCFGCELKSSRRITCGYKH